ncbi:MAG: hypothetical protein QW514_04420 [Thermoprotei archaeon]
MSGTRLTTSRRIAIIAVLTPVAYALSLYPKIPFPPLPFLALELWEVPVYFALLFYDFKTALGIETIVFLVVMSRETLLLLGPVYNLVAILLTMLGYIVGTRLSKLPAVGVASGVALRVAGMSVVNWSLLRYPPPVGFSIPVHVLTATLWLYGVFNATVAAYSLALAYWLNTAVNRAFRGRRPKP